MPTPDHDGPTIPPRQNEEDIEATIDPENHVDESSLESFPASDAPGYSESRVGPSDLPDPDDEAS